MSDGADIILFLVSKGANVDERDIYGRSPIWYAALYGNPEAASTLISLNASVESAEPGGYTPLHMACERGRLEAVEVLVEEGRADVNARS